MTNDIAPLTNSNGIQSVPGAACEGGVQFVSMAIAMLLMVSAALKTYLPQETATLATAYRIPIWLTAAVVQVELLVAVLLLFRFRLQTTLRGTVVLFIGFAIFSAYRVLAGAESCGCFGPVKIPPLATTALDIIVVLAAWVASYRTQDGQFNFSRAVRAMGVFGSLGALAAASFIWFIPSDASDNAIGESGGLVILEPETWIGEKPPIGMHLTPAVNLSAGTWIIVLYHHDCPDCQDALPKYERLAAATQADGTRIVLVEVPPFAEASMDFNAAIHARLPEEIEWFVQAPVEIQIIDGVVTAVSLDLPAISR
ncbi:MAG: hypothetical protein KF847_01715 [Pirellulales bacterium]|nr:hypothetical protein [Pirellulales bacterium]